MKSQIRKIGNSLGIILPSEMLDRVNLIQGDLVNIINVEEGIMISPYDKDFENVRKSYTDFARKYRNTLRNLAK